MSYSLNSRQILLNVEKEKDSKESKVSSDVPRFRPNRHTSIWSSTGRTKVRPSLSPFLFFWGIWILSFKSPTQIDVFVVTETITDSLPTPDTAMVCGSGFAITFPLTRLTISLSFFFFAEIRSGIQAHIWRKFQKVNPDQVVVALLLSLIEESVSIF